MKRQWIMAGILCLCLVALGAVWLAMGNSSKPEEKKEEIALSGKGETARTILAENEQGGYTIEWNKEKAAVKGLEDLPVDEDVAKDVKAALESLTVERKIEDGADRLEDFGLSEASARAEIRWEDGTESQLLLGGEVPDEETSLRYISWNGEVYTTAAGNVEWLEYGEGDFLSRTLTPSETDGDQTVLVTRVSIVPRDGEEMTLAYTDSQELSGYTVNSYEMVSPREYPADASITENLFPGLFGLEADAVASVHPEESEKEAAGLSDPYKILQVEYTDAEGKTQSFSLAVGEPKDGQVPVMADEVDVIYQCSQDKLSWMNVTEQDLVSHTVLAPDIKTLASLEIRAGEEEYVFQMENVGEEEETFRYGEEELDGDSFRSFYYSLISFSADEVLFEDYPDTSAMEEAARIRFVYQDGSEDVLTCFQEAPRQLYVKLDQGERGYRMSASLLENMLSTAKRLAAGEEITARY